ncbi:beta-glucosidase BglX [Plebeiibacterium marinum]|uniref:Periplasmic beta-glucosidase n=1 Tax=Plebeiibacterium marinum TaxID=2992111 RepID=A0AAE3MB13_9BACT|nr:beta-glucosidase BglX [Plebeiobacterium marinum]MCW3804521.1 beta-glucosidase BglX [Plebeiobacterium marinum]
MKGSIIKIGMLFWIGVSILTTSCSEQDKKNQVIDALMGQMTLEEKIAQMNLVTPTSKTGPFATKNVYEKLKDGTAGNVYSVMGEAALIHKKATIADSTRLKIPFLNGLDIIHGYKTIFPIPLALSCTWDTALVEKTARVAAIEGTAVGYNWTFSPMVDITRDPRWGRVMEGAGEDPYLGSLVAKAMVKGYQGDGLSDSTALLSCVKHFALYGASEAGRDYNTTDMSRQTMYQYYLPPYKAAIDAGAKSIMTSFNDVEGIPATANKWLLTDLLRKEWGFNGFVVSDYNCIQELIAHGLASDYKEAAELVVNAGLDMDMASESIAGAIKQSVEEGKVHPSKIDDACRRILEAKYDLGLFEKPYRSFNPERENTDILTNEHKQVAKEAACKAMVLLKNDKQTLPLKREAKIALVGPFANIQNQMFSMWAFRGEADSVVTIYKGLQEEFDNVKYAEGSLITDEPVFLKKSRGYYNIDEQERLQEEAIELAKESDVVVAVLGEAMNMTGEAKSKTDISIPACQRNLLKKLKATGKPVVLVLINGRPLTLVDDLQYADAIVEAWRPGTMAGSALADVLSGDYNPSGKLTMTFPRSVGQIPIYYNHKNTGRPYVDGQRGGIMKFKSYYLDELNAPLFPFGYGLSYTTFEYGDIELSDTLLVGNNSLLKAKIKITNTGAYAGEETVQVYLNDPVASLVRPVKELKKFKKVFLKSGESKEVVFELSTEDLRFFNHDLQWQWEPGEFNLYIGTNSEEIKKVSFNWVK